MVRTCVDSALEELSLISKHPPWVDQVVDKIQSFKMGLRFLRMFFWSLSTLEDSDVEISQFLEPIFTASEDVWGKLGREPFAHPLSPMENLEIEYWALDLQGRIQYSKQKFEESCEFLLICSLRCRSFKMKLILKFLDAVLKNLKDLYKCKTDDEVVLLKNQFETLDKKLSLLHNLFSLIPKLWRNSKEMREFMVAVHAFANNSASLIFLYWVKAVDEEVATRLNLLWFNVLQEIKPCVPVFKAFYIRFLFEMKLRQLDTLLLGQIVQIFLDLLLEDLVDLLKDDFQILQEYLMFIITFLANPPDQLAEDEELMMIIAEIEILVKEDLYLILSVDDMKGNFSKVNILLSDFMWKVELVKSKIQRVYDQIRDSFSYNLPRTNCLGFFSFLLQNLGFLKEKLNTNSNFIPFAKHLIIEIEEELMSLRPYLNDLFEQQKEQKELKDTWLEVISLAYQTEYAINSCSVISHQIWYHMAHLMEVLHEIKVVKSKLKKIEGRKTHDGGVLHCSTVAVNKVIEDVWNSGFNEVVVGLEEEVDIIVENLIRGSQFLDIVAIVGMAGLGKTTLANKVYNASAVRNHFHMLSYCIVSQVHNTRKILLDILCDIMGKDDKIYDMLEEDLAERLRKCLKGQRYLIIMDDIWDSKAWDEVKRSLPNDQNGSRVIFTTRIHNVALQAKSDCILHHLRFLSDEESWVLLQKKVFRTEGCPPMFLEVGKLIAKNCKGLPLAVVLIAGLLARIERSLSWWNKISDAILSYVSTEGCMDMLELSYQHLPEHLKPCFLYFGAFAEDTLIRVNKLTLLWIAEGFVHNSSRKNLENVAKEYLRDLVDRSLVIAIERSSSGGIKSCRIHDLVHEFCRGKAQEENFFQLMDGYEAFNSSNFSAGNPYRVCIQMKGESFNDATKAICPRIHSLLYSRKTGTYFYDPPIFSNCKLVQVMDLGEFRLPAFVLPKITSLVHLRFIAFSYPRLSRTKVPSSISNLWNLEILIVTANRRFNLELPGTIWNMTRLRHVDVGWCYLSNSGVNKRDAYPQMVNLESFSSPTFFSREDLEDLLHRSPALRKLSFQYAERKKILHFPRLDSLSKLESLKVSFVTQLRVRLFNFPSTLKKLSLSGCFLPWAYLPEIIKMPCLEVLKLLENAFVGLEWDMGDMEFPKLKFLKLEQLDLAEWIAFDESFPCLEVLIVNKCYNLNAIPPCFGEIFTLKRIEVYASHKVATSVVELHEVQKEIGNEELEVIVLDSMFLK